MNIVIVESSTVNIDWLIDWLNTAWKQQRRQLDGELPTEQPKATDYTPHPVQLTEN